MLILCLLLTGCELTENLTEELLPGNEKEEEITSLQSISLLYYPDKTLHPLLDTSLANQQIYRSVYLPAVTFDERPDPVYGVASEVVQVGNSISITPAADRKFSDGSDVTAAAIAACFRFVLEHEESPYYRSLQNIIDISSDSGRVVLTLSNKDPGAIYCMDIPICKQGGTEDKPIYFGAGSYKFGQHNNVPALVANPYAAQAPAVSPVYLLTPDSDEALGSMFNSGVLSALPTNLIAQGTLSVSRQYKTVSYLTPTMVYIGVNNEKVPVAARRAFSALIPRQQIIDNVLMGLGQSATLPLYPGWSVVPDPGADASKQRLVELFTAADLQAKNGELLTAEGEKPKYELLVSKENKEHLAIGEKIRSAALNLGIELTLVEVDEGTFKSRLSDGAYEMYIARYTLNQNHSCGELYIGEEAPNYCGEPSTALLTAHENYMDGGAVTDYIATLQQECPILPIAFIKRAIYHTEGVLPAGGLSYSRPLGALEKWSIS